MSWYLSAQPSLAIDGDVVYSAPYIMVDPETGQIVTVNPGPRLKAHEAMPTSGENNATATEITAAADLNTSESVNKAGQSVTTLPFITMLACLFMVITGFFIWKSNQNKA